MDKDLKIFLIVALGMAVFGAIIYREYVRERKMTELAEKLAKRHIIV